MKFLPGQDYPELMDYTLYLRRCGYDPIQFRRDDSAGYGSGFLVRCDDGAGEEESEGKPTVQRRESRS